MARSIGDDEFPPRRGEVAIGNINGDALFSLGSQAVRKQRKINWSCGAVDAALLHGRQLVLVNRLAVIEEPADQRGFSIIHAAGGGEAQWFLRRRKQPGRGKRLIFNLYVDSRH